MQATVQMDQSESRGMFSSKTSYSVHIQLHLDDEELGIIERFSPYQPDPLDSLQLDDYDKEMIAGGLRKRGLLTFTEGFQSSFSSIQQAGKFEDAVLAAFSDYSGQISAARARAAVLGERRVVEM
jgi:hypothetical protein